MVYRYNNYWKRWLDIILSLILLIFLIHVILFVAICIKIFDGGHVFFLQKRVGRNKKPFVIYKFRTMPVNTIEESSDKIGSIKLSRLGSIIRRLNIDEIPQIFNILMGDMSFIGPRPSLFSQLELINLREQFGVLDFKPGLTGLAQVNSFNGMSSIEKVALDTNYCNNISFILDVKILIKTIKYLFSRPPIY